jgi:hypothetical protein
MKSLSLILTVVSIVQGSAIDLQKRASSTKAGYTTTWFDDFTG